jgi:hypothetical protein
MSELTTVAASLEKEKQLPTTVPQRWFHYWPLGVFLLLLLLFDYLLSPAAAISPLPVTDAFLGIFIGHLMIASIIASLARSSWIIGVLLASFFLIFFLIAFVWGDGSYINVYPSRTSPAWYLLWFLLPVPFLCLAGAIPLLIVRNYCGWSIRRVNDLSARLSRIRLEDLFLSMIVFASILSLIIAPSIALEIDRETYLKQVALMAGVNLASTLFGGLPTVWIAFLKLGWLKRILLQGFWMFVSGLVLVWCYLAYTWFFFGVTPITGQITGWVIGALFIVLLPIAFLESLKASRLNFIAKRDLGMTQDGAADSVPDRNPERWNHRCGAVAFALLAIGAHIPAKLIDKSRFDDDQFLAEHYQRLHSRGGEIRVSQGKIVAVAFSDPSFQLTDLEQFNAPESVETLSLERAEIGDGVVTSLNRFPGLQSLDLSYTDITDAAVPDLRELTKLRHLSVSGTQLSHSSIHQLASLWHLNALDLGDLHLDDDFRMPTTWSLKRERSLSLRGNRELTDRWSALPENDLSRGRFGYLDLSGTGIKGTLFEKPISTRRLLLHDVAITDQILANVATNIHVTGVISLENTLLTDASLPVIASKIPARSWSLGDGNFTEAGLAALTNTRIDHLELRGKQFTGVCFEKWNPFLYEVVLTGSSVTDETIVALRNLTSLQTIGLAGTAISDRSLAEIAKFPIMLMTIDVSDTRVTVEGLLQNVAPYTEIVVRPGQFKPEELRILRSRMTVSVGQSVRSYR